MSEDVELTDEELRIISEIERYEGELPSEWPAHDCPQSVGCHGCETCFAACCLDAGAPATPLELTNLLARKPRQLSGGQQLRVALARALVRHPRFLGAWPEVHEKGDEADEPVSPVRSQAVGSPPAN